MFDIITAMGRMRIKKKGDAKPFRETMAYRLLLVLLSILFFVFTFYEVIHFWMANNTLNMVIALAAAVLTIISLFYNLDRARQIPMPDRRRHR